MDRPANAKPVVEGPNLAALAYASSIYFIAVGAAYLWAYWSAFSINILEYLALTDVLKHAAFPVASSVASLVIGVLLGHITSPTGRMTPGAGKETAIGRVLNKYSRTLFVVSMIVVLTLYSVKLPALRHFAPFMAALVISVPIGNLPAVQALLHDDYRYTVVLLLCALPLLSYSVGESRAAEIMEGERFRFLATDGVEPRAALRYVGHASDEYFFFDSRSKAMVLIKRPADKNLVLGSFKR